MTHKIDPRVAKAINHDRAMRLAQERHDGTWSAATAVQRHRIKRDAARSEIPRPTLVAN